MNKKKPCIELNKQKRNEIPVRMYSFSIGIMRKKPVSHVKPKFIKHVMNIIVWRLRFILLVLSLFKLVVELLFINMLLLLLLLFLDKQQQQQQQLQCFFIININIIKFIMSINMIGNKIEYTDG